jgi:hypothetical protein
MTGYDFKEYIDERFDVYSTLIYWGDMMDFSEYSIECQTHMETKTLRVGEWKKTDCICEKCKEQGATGHYYIDTSERDTNYYDVLAEVREKFPDSFEYECLWDKEYKYSPDEIEVKITCKKHNMSQITTLVEHRADEYGGCASCRDEAN